MVVALCVASGASAKEVPSPWTWTDYGPALRDVSCSSPGVCVAVGQRGVSLRNDESAAAPLAWSKGFLTYPEELTGVTCNDNFCLAVSNTRTSVATFVSQVFRSTDHGKTWSDGVALEEAGKQKTRSAKAIACDPSAGACYAVGKGGGVWRSIDEGRKWTALNLPSATESYDRVACPADDTCVAVGGETLGHSALIEGKKVTVVKLPKKAGGMLGLACDSATRCTATDDLGHYMSMSIPDKEWGPVMLFPLTGTEPTSVSALSCPIEDVCVGLEAGQPEVMRTTSLSDGDWEARPIDTPDLEAITCAQTACIAVGKRAGWFASFDAGDNWGRVNEVGKFDAIQCSASLSPTCVAGGKEDLGVSSFRGELWSLPLNGQTGLNVKSVDCTVTSECLFLGKTQTLFTDDLQSFSTRQPTTIAPAGTDALTCITDDVCVGVGKGVVYTTLDGALTPWTQNAFKPQIPTSVACIRGSIQPAKCVVTTAKYIVFGTMTKTAGRISWDWKYAHVNPAPEELTAVGCSPGGECTAVGAAGEVWTSEGTDLMRWTRHIVPEDVPVDERPLLSSVACPADGVCLAGGIHGDDAIVASTRNGWKDFSYDKIPGIEGAAPTITGFGCESVDRCVAVGSTALVGVVEHRRGHRR